MKLFLCIVLFAFPFDLHAQVTPQQLLGSWVRVKAEMKDGSQIVIRGIDPEAFSIYQFSSNTQGSVCSTPFTKKDSFNYIVRQDTLILPVLKFLIKKIDRQELILEEIGEALPADRTMVQHFIRDSHYKELFEANYRKVQYKTDSVYLLSKWVFPDYEGSFYDDFIKKVDHPEKRIEVKVSFILDSTGKVTDIMTSNEGQHVNKRLIKDISEAIASTQGKWKPVRVNNRPQNLLIEFIFNFSMLNSEHKFTSVGLGVLNIKTEPKWPQLSIEQEKAAGRHFNAGLKKLSSQKYEEAIALFTKCVAIDEINLDAYYNRAFANMQLGKSDEACKDWGLLVELDQQEAIKYFNEYCKTAHHDAQ